MSDPDRKAEEFIREAAYSSGSAKDALPGGL